MSESWKDRASNITKRNHNASFRPLVGLSITWKNSMTTSIDYTKSLKVDETYTNGINSGENKTFVNSINAKVNYSKRSNFRIPIPIWPFKNMKLKNNIDFSLSFTYSSNLNKSNLQGGRDVDRGKTEKWSLRPNINYSFSNTVTGGAFFEMGQTKSKLNGTIKTQELGINVNISIRGR